MDGDEIARRFERIERVLAEFIGQDAKRGSVFLRPLLWVVSYWRKRALRSGDKGD